jgi:hypothetical protein
MKLFNFLLLLLLIGCVPFEPGIPERVEGYVPVYGDEATSEIKFSSPRAVVLPGKIYTYGSYLLINEVNLGIHLYDNTDPANPEPLGFIEIVGNTDMAIRDNILYVNHMGSLVALNVSNLSAPQKVGEVSITNWLLGVPPPSGSYFQCVESGKGLVIGWRKQELKKPECYAL